MEWSHQDSLGWDSWLLMGEMLQNVREMIKAFSIQFTNWTLCLYLYQDTAEFYCRKIKSISELPYMIYLKPTTTPNIYLLAQQFTMDTQRECLKLHVCGKMCHFVAISLSVIMKSNPLGYKDIDALRNDKHKFSHFPIFFSFVRSAHVAYSQLPYINFY